ncbi:MAG: hypothetical protein IJW49_01215 [Clostridia bacterium]|nr:hypothetical protein [Clostridia bacterium]
MEEERFATILREEDFLDHKLSDKPDYDPVYFRALTEEEKARTSFGYKNIGHVTRGGSQMTCPIFSVG